MDAWKDYRGKRVYRVAVYIDHEFTAYCPSLPGVVADGETIEECCESLREAFVAAVETYESMGETVPWIKREPRPLFHEVRYIIAEITSFNPAN